MLRYSKRVSDQLENIGIFKKMPAIHETVEDINGSFPFDIPKLATKDNVFCTSILYVRSLNLSGSRSAGHRG